MLSAVSYIPVHHNLVFSRESLRKHWCRKP